MLRTTVIVLILLLAAWRVSEALSSPGGAAFPNRPVHVVVPYTAGGGTDSFARIMQGGKG